MTQAGYSAGGMAAMFEKLDRASRFNDSGDYPYLRSHPLTIDRIGEARSRSGAGGTLTATGSVMLHAAMQARGYAGDLRFLSTPAVRGADVALAVVFVAYGFGVEIGGRLA